MKFIDTFLSDDVSVIPQVNLMIIYSKIDPK